jgi:[acyl-carrier-protein] S-malonyltransferase
VGLKTRSAARARHSKIALMFPGQGVQHVGMGKALAETYPVARRTFSEASDVLGYDIAKACFFGPEGRLNATLTCQPAIVTVSVAALRVAEQHGLRGDIVMGHSLGEYTALVANGSLRFSDALTIVARRAELTADVAAETPGAMVALLGVAVGAARKLCAQAGEVWVANDNCPGQVVASGHRAGVERLLEIARVERVRTRLLDVDGAFHSRVMAPAVDGLRTALRGVRIGTPTMPFLSSTTARLETGDGIRDLLVRQLTSPVRFRAAVRSALPLGVDRFVELGPRSVLGGLVSRATRSGDTIHFGSPEHLPLLASILT